MSAPIRRPAAAVMLLGALALTACSSLSGNSSSGSAASSAAAEPAKPGAAATAAAGAASGAASDAAGKAGRLDSAAVQPRVVRTAQVVVQVDGELPAAAARVRAVALSVGGSVANETTTYADTGDTTEKAGRPGQSVLVLRVPSDALDRTLSLITGTAGVGKELSRSGTSQDVTADLADLQSRVATQRASVARVRALLAQATSLQQVVSIESEVTKRESDLEAAEAREAALADRADLATLTVDLRTPAVVPPPPPGKPNPFLDGLESGWRAVTASTAIVLTVLGALLPVAVVLGVLGAPVLWWLRRRRPVGPPVAPPPAAPDTGA
jgi:PIN domain nuclease of toxin-antitoxin system